MLKRRVTGRYAGGTAGDCGGEGGKWQVARAELGCVTCDVWVLAPLRNSFCGDFVAAMGG